MRLFLLNPSFCSPLYMLTALGRACLPYSSNHKWSILPIIRSKYDTAVTYIACCTEQVLETCQQWVDAATADKASNVQRMAKFLKDIQGELAKL